MSPLAVLLVLGLAAPAPPAAPSPAAFPGVSGYSWAFLRAPSGPVTDADFALFHMQRALWDPVEPERLGSLDPRLHARVNGEIYRFASRRTLALFRRHPVRWCGLLRDPVTGERFVPDARSPRADLDGVPYFFAGDSTRAAFLKSPRTFEVKREI